MKRYETFEELKAYTEKMVELLITDVEHHFENCCRIETTIRNNTHLPEIAKIVELMDDPDKENYNIIEAIDEILGIYWDKRCHWCEQEFHESELTEQGLCLTCDRAIKSRGEKI